MDRRRTARLALQLSCRLIMRDSRTATGQTINVSRTGLLIRFPAAIADDLPRPGDLVRVEVESPEKDGPEKGIRLHCEGLVIRVEQDRNEETLLGLQVESMRFRTDGRRARSPLSRIKSPVM